MPDANTIFRNDIMPDVHSNYSDELYILYHSIFLEMFYF